MEEITTELPLETGVATDVAADLPEPASIMSRFEQGRRWYGEQGRPLSPEETTDAALMAGWFYEWGFSDALSGTCALFLQETFPVPPYADGFSEGKAFEGAAERLQNVADAAFDQYCVAQGWSDAYILEHCAAAEEYVCDRGSVTLMYALINRTTPIYDEADPESASPELAPLDPLMIFAVRFNYADGAFTLKECADCMGDEPQDFPVDRAALPEMLTPEQLSELKTALANQALVDMGVLSADEAIA
jgi:hypothetical protein